jgi:hypothetical protein
LVLVTDAERPRKGIDASLLAYGSVVLSVGAMVIAIASTSGPALSPETRILPASVPTTGDVSRSSALTEQFKNVQSVTVQQETTIGQLRTMLERQRAEFAEFRTKAEAEVAKLKGYQEVLQMLFKDGRLGRKSVVKLDPTSREFQRVDTDTGFLLVSCKTAVPYLDGYKVMIQIGNPFLVTFTDFHVDAWWGRPQGQNEDYIKWRGDLQHKQFNCTQSLSAGRWNDVELILSPAEPEHVKHIEITIETPRLSLLAPDPTSR